MRLGEIARVVDSGLQSLASELAGIEPIGYSIDSRTIRPGELFIAIRGERKDGHEFVPQAFERGAVAAIVSAQWAASGNADSTKLIPVSDTLEALQSVASTLLRRWRGRLVAITGSMGKTTTKEMTAAVLSEAGRVIKTVGNFNNAYGLPLSVLKMESDGAHSSDFDFAVFEMGMNHKGELAALTSVAPPDLAVVTNVAPVHLEFFSSVDEIAEAKSELVTGVKPEGTAVLNADDERVARMASIRSDIRFRTFGIERAADVTASDIKTEGLALTGFTLTTPSGSVEATTRLAGRHNIYNALAAAAVADFYGMSVEDTARLLREFHSPKMRGEVYRLERGVTLVDDSYNSNPRALLEMAAMICAPAGYKRRIVVAGEMLELGPEGPRLHRETGERIASLGVEALIGVRGLAREFVGGARDAGMASASAIFCETPEEAAEWLMREAREADLVLVKGSRGVKTDIVVDRLKQWGKAKTE